MANLKLVNASTTVSPSSWGAVTLVASTGKLLRITLIYAKMDSGTSGSRAIITISDSAAGVLAEASNSTPETSIKEKATSPLWASDSAGPRVLGYNADVASSRTMYYGYIGIED